MAETVNHPPAKTLDASVQTVAVDCGLSENTAVSLVYTCSKPLGHSSVDSRCVVRLSESRDSKRRRRDETDHATRGRVGCSAHPVYHGAHKRHGLRGSHCRLHRTLEADGNAGCPSPVRRRDLQPSGVCERK